MLQPKKPSDYSATGKMILLYGESSVGKTTSILASAPEPISFLDSENRNPIPSLEACGREVDVDFYDYTNWKEIMEFYDDLSNFERHKTVVVDSLTHLMNIQLSGELEDEAFVARDEDDKLVKPLISSVKLSKEGYGAISTQMIRLMKKLSIIRKAGKTVIVTALLAQDPRWDRDLKAGPALKGNEFPAALPGFCDLIGMVRHNVNEEGKIIYPPIVHFEAPKMDFLAKFTGVRPSGASSMAGPLRIDTILKMTTTSK